MARALHDVDAERAYFAWILVDNALFSAYPVPAEDFHLQRHVYIARTMQALWEKGLPIDTSSLRSVLEAERLLAKVGGDEGLLEATPAPFGPMPISTAPRIRELALARRMLESIERAKLELLERRVGAALEIVNEVSDRARLAGQRQILSAGAVVEHSMTEYRAFDDSATASVRLPSGIRAYDAITGGLDPADWLTVGADTNVGKSWVALTMALQRAGDGHRTGIISLEDPEKRWGVRLASVLSGLEGVAIQRHQLGRDDYPKVAHAIARANELGIFFGFCLDGHIDGVIDTMRSLVLDHGCTQVELDYAQNLEGIEADTTHASFTKIYTRLRRAFERLKVAGVVFSQVKRGQGPRRGGPDRGDLKEGGNIEQKSDHIAMLRRDSKRRGYILGRLTKTKGKGNGLEWEWEQLSHGALVEAAPIRSEDFEDGAPKESDLEKRALAEQAKRAAEAAGKPGPEQNDFAWGATPR